MTEPLHIISLGAGVQSTTMALMAAHGEITPMPVAAIFADTGGEPAAVYRHLDWLRSPNVLPFPVEVVQWSNLEEDIHKLARDEPLDHSYGFSIPAKTAGHAETTGMLRRQCTGHYKISPVRRRARELLGGTGPIRGDEVRVCQWIGFSADEFVRAKTERGKKDPKWIAKRFPLIERHTGDGLGGLGSERWMSIGDCYEWLKRREYPKPPRSACVFCPYLKNEQWREMRDEHPDDWQRAVAVDRAIRNLPDKKGAGLKKGGTLYLHSSRTPLESADLRDPDKTQSTMWPAFTEECEGMCGV